MIFHDAEIYAEMWRSFMLIYIIIVIYIIYIYVHIDKNVFWKYVIYRTCVGLYML